MDQNQTLRRIAGALLAVSGVGCFVAGALHPQAAGARNFGEAMTIMLSSARWTPAHWVALVTGLLTALALWLYADAGLTRRSAAAHVGARLATIGAAFMSVEWAVEIAAGADATPAVAALVDAMQGAGWPAFGIGFALLAIGTRAVPRWVAAVGVIGGLALALAGLFAQALHVVQAGVLFAGGHLLALWMVWTGVTVAGRPGGTPEP